MCLLSIFRSSQLCMEHGNMFIQLTTLLCAIQMLTNECRCMKFVDLPSDSDYPDARSNKLSKNAEHYSKDTKINRRFFTEVKNYRRQNPMEMALKQKVAVLVAQSIHDTIIAMESVQELKDRLRVEAPYRIGFLFSIVKKTRATMNELFDMTVQYKDDWKALEASKVFEMVIKNNVDMTNYVKQLVETHRKYRNDTVGRGGAV
ncbi:uncharacterized protein LOC142975106 [Anticarsia gemmatalis]|uniref:uncharacterized protein LOC142975106 n=1 Tax=Anticarsia gemmatalis TaxID=129554 RepID=UPI003F765DA2